MVTVDKTPRTVTKAQRNVIAAQVAERMGFDSLTEVELKEELGRWGVYVNPNDDERHARRMAFFRECALPPTAVGITRTGMVLHNSDTPVGDDSKRVVTGIWSNTLGFTAESFWDALIAQRVEIYGRDWDMNEIAPRKVTPTQRVKKAEANYERAQKSLNSATTAIETLTQSLPGLEVVVDEANTEIVDAKLALEAHETERAAFEALSPEEKAKRVAERRTPKVLSPEDEAKRARTKAEAQLKKAQEAMEAAKKLEEMLPTLARANDLAEEALENGDEEPSDADLAAIEGEEQSAPRRGRNR